MHGMVITSDPILAACRNVGVHETESLIFSLVAETNGCTPVQCHCLCNASVPLS